MKRPLVIAMNAILVLMIIGLITATWLPAIYTSRWFQQSPWVKAHILKKP